jgi:hypothetical protein
MLKQFFRFFRFFPWLPEIDERGERIKALYLEKERLFMGIASDKDLIWSLNRYIGALEGRDEERLVRIGELEDQNRKQADHIEILRGVIEKQAGLIRETRERLAGIMPNRKEDV